MGILARLIHTTRSNLSGLLRRVEDPRKRLEQALADMEEAYRTARHRVEDSMADTGHLEETLVAQRSEAEHWHTRAVQAVAAGDDAGGREALRRRNEHGRRVAQIGQELTRHVANLERLRQTLREMDTRIGQLRQRQGALLARHSPDAAQNGIALAGAEETIERIGRKIEELSALARMHRELKQAHFADTGQQGAPGAEAAEEDVEGELLALKRRSQAGPGEEG